MSKEITLKDVMDSIAEIKSEIAGMKSEINELKVELKASEVRQREYTDRAVEKLVLEFVPESKTTDWRRLSIPREERALQRR